VQTAGVEAMSVKKLAYVSEEQVSVKQTTRFRLQKAWFVT
jgi:hypothetical protein